MEKSPPLNNFPGKLNKIDVTRKGDHEIIELDDLADTVDIIETKTNRTNAPVDTADGRGKRGKGAMDTDIYHTKKSVAEGMMDISLLTANANQLKFLLFYNRNSSTFWPAITLIMLSLVLQIVIGFTLIFRRRFKTHGRRRQVNTANEILVLLMFLVTIINILAAVLTTTD